MQEEDQLAHVHVEMSVNMKEEDDLKFWVVKIPSVCTSCDTDDGVFVLQPFDRRISHQSSQIIVNGRRGIIDPE